MWNSRQGIQTEDRVCQEDTLFVRRDVRVTTGQVTVRQLKYHVAEISKVRMFLTPPPADFEILPVVYSALFVLLATFAQAVENQHVGDWWVALLTLAGLTGLLNLFRIAEEAGGTTAHLAISDGTRENVILSSHSEIFVTNVANAIEQAIRFRIEKSES